MRLWPPRLVGHAVMIQRVPGRGRASIQADIRPSRSGVLSKLLLCGSQLQAKPVGRGEGTGVKP